MVFLWDESHVGSSYVSYEDTFLALDAETAAHMKRVQNVGLHSEKVAKWETVTKSSPECKFAAAEMVIWN